MQMLIHASQDALIEKLKAKLEEHKAKLAEKEAEIETSAEAARQADSRVAGKVLK